MATVVTSEEAAGRTARPQNCELADILRACWRDYARTHPLPASHGKVIRDIMACRTAALGGHLERCDACGYERPAYNSCRNRHCPKCQSLVKARWLEARRSELLPVGYFHVVFTLPHQLNPLALANKRPIYDLLFLCAADTLKDFGADPRHGLEGRMGFSAILHTWDNCFTITSICTVWCPGEPSLLTATTGEVPRRTSSSRSRPCPGSSGANSSRPCGRPSSRVRLSSPVKPAALPPDSTSINSHVLCGKPNGSSTAKGPFPARTAFWITLGDIPIGWPCPTIEYCPSKTEMSASPTGTEAITTDEKLLPWKQMSSSGGFSFTCCPALSCACGISVFLPTAPKPGGCQSVGLYWGRIATPNHPGRSVPKSFCVSSRALTLRAARAAAGEPCIPWKYYRPGTGHRGRSTAAYRRPGRKSDRRRISKTAVSTYQSLDR